MVLSGYKTRRSPHSNSAAPSVLQVLLIFHWPYSLASDEVNISYGHILGLPYTNYIIVSYFLCAEFVKWKRNKDVTSVLTFVGRFGIPDIAEWI